MNSDFFSGLPDDAIADIADGLDLGEIARELQPPGVSTGASQLSFGALLAEDNGFGMPFPDRGNSQSDYLELPPPEEPVDWGEYQVHVARHAVHLVTEANGEKEYVVSNMKKFKVDIMLYNVKTGQLATDMMQ